MAAAELVQSIRDIVVIAGTVSATVAAWKGLTAWRRQMVGKEHHRVAAELLRAAIRWRIAMRAVRVPLMFGQEMVPLPDEVDHPLPGDDEPRKGQIRGYTRRWNRVQEHRAELETAVVEGEIYLGK